MKRIGLIIAAILCLQVLQAQVFFTKNGYVSFYSHTNVEDIKAENFEVVSFIDAAKKELRFQLLIKGFQFPKATMQEHFNSASYMDSDTYPKAEFKGTFSNPGAVNFSRDGVYPVEVQGDLTIHGITQKIKEKGTITIKNGKPSANAVFNVKRSDFKITTPGFSAAKIADEIQVTLKCEYEPYKS